MGLYEMIIRTHADYNKMDMVEPVMTMPNEAEENQITDQ